MQFQGLSDIPGVRLGRVWNFTVLAVLLPFVLAGCDLFSSAVDDRAPRVEILYPAGDAVVSGRNVRIVIEATAPGEDNFVSFANITLNGVKVGEAVPVRGLFIYNLDTIDLSDGDYRVEAVAFDRYQARGISGPVHLTVQNESLADGPLVRIIAPSSGEEVTGSVRIVARVDQGQPPVTRADLLVDGAVVLTTTTATTNDTYTFEWDTSRQLAGEHSLEVKAFSGPQTFRLSETVFVNVLQLEDPDGKGRPGTVRWRTAGYGGEVKGSVAVGFNSDLYVGSSSDTLYAFSPLADLKWKFATRGPIRSSPLVGNNEDVFVTSEDGRLYGLNSDGHQLWQAYETYASLRSSPALGVEGVIYFGDSNGKVHAVSSFNGASVGGNWPVAVTTTPIVAPPVIAQDRTVVVAATDGFLYALSPEGDVLWQSPENIGGIMVGMALVEKTIITTLAPGVIEEETMNVIYAVSNSGKIYSLSGVDGSVRWSENLTGPLRSGPVVGPDGTIYVGTSTGLIAFNEDTDPFTPRLRFIFVATDVGTPAIDSNDVVYFVSRDRVYAINPNNTPVWSFDLETEADAPLTITRNGQLIVPGQNGILTSLETGSVGLALEKWPMFQRNARHTGRLGIDARD